MWVRNVILISRTITNTRIMMRQTVLGFCISYRTSSAYERFIEGRKLWQQVHVATRLASRLIWFHCPTQCTLDVAEEEKEADAARALIEKKVSKYHSVNLCTCCLCLVKTSLRVNEWWRKGDARTYWHAGLLLLQTMLNLLEAFAVSLKHYLRGESGIHYEDLYHLILFLPKVCHS